MKLATESRPLLKQGNKAEGIRLSSVAGSCGPQFAISLVAPIETDTGLIIIGTSSCC